MMNEDVTDNTPPAAAAAWSWEREAGKMATAAEINRKQSLERCSASARSVRPADGDVRSYKRQMFACTSHMRPAAAMYLHVFVLHH